MGTDIHTFAERKVDDQWKVIPDLSPFDWRSYGMFGFLADVRNYSRVPPIAPTRGLPEDLSGSVKNAYSAWGEGGVHGMSWLSVDELEAFNYDHAFENRRTTAQIAPGYFSGAVVVESGHGKHVTFREFLGEGFFDEIKRLRDAGAERIVFWFDC